MTIDPTGLARLKALAEAATPGPWESTYGNVTTPSGDDVVGLDDYGATEGRQSELHSAIEAARALRAKKAGE